MSEFKNLPYHDPKHVAYAEQHNATSEAVIQLQGLVHALRQEVADLKGVSRSTMTARKTAAK